MPHQTAADNLPTITVKFLQEFAKVNEKLNSFILKVSSIETKLDNSQVSKVGFSLENQFSSIISSPKNSFDEFKN